MLHQSMNYGELPNVYDFYRHWQGAEVGDTFAIRNCKRVGDVDFTQAELYAELQAAVSEWNGSDDVGGQDEAGDWASCVLSVLGFEWV